MGSLFPGLQSLLNYHPLFVHFPIALWATAFLFEIAARVVPGEWVSRETMHHVALASLALGALAAIPTVMTGWSAQEAVASTGPAHEAKELHENLMVSASILSGILAALGLFVLPRKPLPMLRLAFLAGLVLLVVLMAFGADRGAMLVYHYGTGVDWSAVQKQN